MRLSTASPPASDPFKVARLPRPTAAAILIAALAVIFALDHATDAAPIQHLYYAPIIFAALRFGQGGALLLAAAATLLYHVANPHLFSFQYEEVDVVQMALFLAVGVVAARLASDSRRLHRLAMTDDLTGLHNLRSFEQQFKVMVRAAREGGAPLSVLVLDVDELKSLNDVHGHLAGAEAVRTVGHIIAARVPDGAVACRYGGDEFVVALPDHTGPQAAEVARDLGHAVHELAPRLASHQFPTGRLSISLGAACWNGADRIEERTSITDDQRGERLFTRADNALYAAKQGGRNRVCLAEG